MTTPKTSAEKAAEEEYPIITKFRRDFGREPTDMEALALGYSMAEGYQAGRASLLAEIEAHGDIRGVSGRVTGITLHKLRALAAPETKEGE